MHTAQISRSRRLSSRLALVSLLAAGCGGKGGGIGVDTARVSATPSTILYGADARLSWSAASSATFDSSNFGLDDSNFRGGSIVDTPGTTTRYELKVRSESGNTVPARATVTVSPLAVPVLVVGDTTKPGPAQIGDFMHTLVSENVKVSSTLEAPSSRYGVLVVSPTFAPQAGAAATVKAWLDAGKGVVLCGRSPRLLATGDSNNSNVSAIGSWFFGATQLTSFYANTRSLRSSAGIVRLSSVVRGGRDDASDGEASLPPLGPQVDFLSVDSERGYLSAYAVPTGGRLVWSASPVGYGNAPDGTFQQAFESAVNWAGNQLP